MAAQRTLNPLIQVRILVPRPFKKKDLSTKEEINPDRYCTRGALDEVQCNARDFVFKSMFSPRKIYGLLDMKDH